ncbi:MFS transporter [Streptomyces sp. NBC_01264]|uniref:MFS transporter n=1 Tax=Streptomyces sp. NBC_01264 TaxID=2903804 RepID=UPI00224E6474|nr:MFS transporter [Streptomyces sp. NBC_01264]MCX4783601.1 MFS transporter [Streptomyces sp. NBC_01264]
MLIVLTASGAAMLIGLDITAVTVALPAIGSDLGVGVNGLQWVMASYALVMAVLLLLAGAAGDRLGYRRSFFIGMAVFTVASVLCCLAPNAELLIVFRVLQAVGAAGILPIGMSIVAHTFENEAQRSRAVGVFSSLYGLGLALGPLFGGLLVAAVGWRGIFWINLPAGALVMVLTAACVPDLHVGRPRSLDVFGQLLVIALLGPLIFAIIEAPQLGWGSVPILLCLAVSAASLAAFVTWERRQVEPMVDLRLFGSAPFTCAAGIGCAIYGAFAGVLFVSTLYLDDIKGFSALRAGIWMLPMAGMVVLCAPLSGWLTGRYGARPSLVTAGWATMLGGLDFALAHAETHPALLLIGFVLFGVAMGMANPPTTLIAIAGMPKERAGLASAIQVTSRRVGFALGTAVVGAVLASGWHRSDSAAHFTTASRAAWWIITGCGIAAIALAIVGTGSWAAATAARAAAHMSRR